MYYLQFGKYSTLSYTFLTSDENAKDTKITGSTETHLHGLQKYTNYSLHVLAFTAGGEGVRSPVIHCQTDQDSEFQYFIISSDQLDQL